MSNAKVRTTKKVKKVYNEESRKKGVKIAIITVASVVAAILIVGIILGCVKANGFTALEGYEYVTINNGASSVISVESETDDNKDAFAVDKRFKDGLKKSKYSLLRGIFEGVWSNGYKFAMQDVEYREQNKKGEYVTKTKQERVAVKSADVEEKATTQNENEYSLVFDFGRTENGEPAKSIKVEGEVIAYDTAIVVLSGSGDNIIEKYTVYFYDAEKIYGDGSEYYEINPVVVKANANGLYEAVKDILAYSQTNGF